MSGSLQPQVGAWLAPDGSDITNSSADHFDVNLGGEDYPGSISMEVEFGYSLSSNNQGVYTCTIPDENGEQQYLHVGIYRYGFDGESLNFSWMCIEKYGTVNLYLFPVTVIPQLFPG